MGAGAEPCRLAQTAEPRRPVPTTPVVLVPQETSRARPQASLDQRATFEALLKEATVGALLGEHPRHRSAAATRGLHLLSQSVKAIAYRWLILSPVGAGER